MKQAFILYLVEAPNGKRYIGITSRSIADRWFKHLQESRCTRANRAISNAIRKYGAAGFTITELDRAASWLELCQKERDAISQYGTFAPRGYNLTRGGDGFTGRHSAETRAKMRAAHIGKVRSQEHCRNLSIALTGKRHAPEVYARIEAKKRARPMTEAENARMARMQALNVGRVPSAEHRAKIRAAHLGRPKPTLRGKPLSAERRAKISAAHLARRRLINPQQETFNGI